MDVTFRSTCLGMATVLVLGCGSGAGAPTTYPPQVDSGQPDINANDGAVTPSKPAPMSSADSVPLFAGTTALLTSGASCTSEVGAVGDRWCAFIALSKTSLGSVDLFAVNVSQAAAGVPVHCGSTNGDPNCLRLTGGYFEDRPPPGPPPPTLRTAQFRGDTLVYFDAAATAYGWRPGMANGRALARNLVPGDVHDCMPAPKGTAVYCLQGPLTGDVIQSDLLVGRLDGAQSPPLARVDTVISTNTGDTGHLRFQVGFPTPAGDVIAWSSRSPGTVGATGGTGGTAGGTGGAGGVGGGQAQAPGPEILKVQKVDDATTRRTVATDVTRWSTSPDGRQWYWLSQWGTNSGTLQTAPFANGAAPTTLISSVGNFRVAPTGGVVSLTSTRALQGIVDPIGAPTTIVSIDTGVFGILQVSDQGHVAYAKNQDPFLLFIDLYVNKLDGTGTRCTLSSQLNGEPFARFVPGSGAVLWARSDLNAAVGSAPDGLFTSLSNCRTATVGAGIAGLDLVQDSGVLVADQYDGTDETLRVRNVIGGNALGGGTPVVIQTRVNSFLTVSPSSPLVVYTVNAGSPSDGIYVYSVAAAPMVTDAGPGDSTMAGDGNVSEAGTDAGTEAGDDTATGVPADAASDTAADAGTAPDASTAPEDAGTAPDAGTAADASSEGGDDASD